MRLAGLLGAAHRAGLYLRLTPAGRRERRRDRSGLGDDPGIDRATEASIAWIALAQDRSSSNDGGVARHYSLVSGWGSSYPETTGYIIPTLLDWAGRRKDHSVRDRARRMLDWIASIQRSDGGFQGGMVDSRPDLCVAFNTGQILIGLAAGVEEFGEIYRPALRSAADWLVTIQDPDGCWRRHPSPFAVRGDKTYDAHLAWGLLQAARVEGGDAAYASAALRNVSWVLTRQAANGWLPDCCLTDGTRPLTHTLGYALRGIIEAYRFTRDGLFLRAAIKTAEGILGALGKDGFLPGRLDAEWKQAADWCCLTGTCQIAHCWLMLYQDIGERRFREAAFAANRFVRRTVRLQGPPEILGAIKGAFPIWGEYAAYEYPNWACKFFIDSNLLEKSVLQAGA